jgi:O-antigen/teichoic acid export membrane protein
LVRFRDKVIVTGIVNLTVAALGTITGIIQARVLGAEGRGEFAALTNWPALAVTLGIFGMSTAVAFFSGRKPEESGRILTTALIFLLLWSLPLCAVIFLFMPRLLVAQSHYIVQAARVYLILVPLQFTFTCLMSAFQGLGRIGLWNALRLLIPVGWLLGILLGWAADNLSAMTLSHLYIVLMAIAVGVAGFTARRQIARPFRPDIARIGALLGFGIPTTLSTAPQVLNLRLDQLIMAAIFLPQTLGLYVVAVTWSGVFSPVLLSVSQVAFPTMIALDHREAQTDAIRRILPMSSLVTILLSVGTLVVTPVVIPLLFGTEFTGSIAAAQVLVVAGGLASMNNLLSEILRGMGLPKWPFVAEVAGLVVTVALLLLLLHRYLLIGAAIASLGSYAVTFVTLILILSQLTARNLWRDLLPRPQDVRMLWQLIVGMMAKPRQEY